MLEFYDRKDGNGEPIFALFSLDGEDQVAVYTKDDEAVNACYLALMIILRIRASITGIHQPSDVQNGFKLVHAMVSRMLLHNEVINNRLLHNGANEAFDALKGMYVGLEISNAFITK